MMARPPKEALILGMPFCEALERYAGVPLGEVKGLIKRTKKKKPIKRKKVKRKKR